MIDIRILIVVIIGGIALTGYGWEELRLARGAQAEPTAVELVEIEKGNRPANAHIKLGEHIRLYGSSIYRYEKGKNEAAGPQNKVTECFVPVISDEHPFLLELGRLRERYGSLSKLPKGVEMPSLRGFSLLIKTDRFAKVGDLPDDAKREESATGLIVNEIKSLSTKQVQLIRGNFPEVDASKLLILEEGRKPSSKVFSLVLMTLGGVLIVGTVIAGIASYRS